MNLLYLLLGIIFLILICCIIYCIFFSIGIILGRLFNPKLKNKKMGKIESFFRRYILFYAVVGCLFFGFAFCLVTLGEFIKKEGELYDMNKKESITDYIKWRYEKPLSYTPEQKLKEDIDVAKGVLDKLVEHNSKGIDFIENLCLGFSFENKIDKEVANNVCSCVREKAYNTFPMDGIFYLMDNLKNWDFLVYKNDQDAVKMDKMFKTAILDCTDEYEKSLKTK